MAVGSPASIKVRRRFLVFDGGIIRSFFMAVGILILFRVLQYFPGMSIFNELWIVLLGLFLSTTYLFDKAKDGWSFLSFELYVLLALVMLPLWTGLAAHFEFGQPFAFGALANRNVFLMVGALFIMYMVKHRKINVKDIERALCWLAWCTLILFVLINMLLDPTHFMDYKGGFVGGGGSSEASFKFNTLFIIFGFYYYIFQGFRYKSRKFYMYGMLFLAYLVFLDGGRSLLLSVFLSCFYFIWRWASWRKLFVLMPKFLLGIVLAVGLAIVVNPSGVLSVATKFVDAFTVVATGEKSNDASANARILESAIALPYIQKHWAFGNGKLSNKWHDGYEGQFGYFFPSDIGVIGVLYIYGFLGLLFFLGQFYYAISIANKLPYSPLLDGVKGFLLYFILHSVVTGRFVHFAEISLFFIAILYCMKIEAKRVRGVMPSV